MRSARHGYWSMSWTKDEYHEHAAYCRDEGVTGKRDLVESSRVIRRSAAGDVQSEVFIMMETGYLYRTMVSQLRFGHAQSDSSSDVCPSASSEVRSSSSSRASLHSWCRKAMPCCTASQSTQPYALQYQLRKSPRLS